MLRLNVEQTRAKTAIYSRNTAWVLVFVALSFCAQAGADDKKRTLEDLRGRIERLNRDLAKTEESKTEVTDQLKGSEKAISEANRNLLALARDQTAIGRELGAVEKRIKEARDDIGREEILRDRLIRHQYMFGNTDATRLVLGGEDVSLVERQLAYLGYVTRARIATIGRLKTKIAQLAALEADARDQQARLGANADEQRGARKALIAERASRHKVLSRLRADTDRSRREVGRLKRDENRLSKLIEQIALELARKSEPRAKAGEPPRIRRPGEVVTEVVDAGFVGRAFATLKGKLKLPVKGELTGRFGAQREDGGLTWKGLFIRAGEGQPVRAVADGRVVYVDWLRGYGNLVIVDHGAGFLSLYGHNESVTKHVGEITSAGEAIASVGSTGGAADSGVYFELRQDGKPFDPMRWVGR